MFKSYSSKSKAKRGLQSYAKDVTLTEEAITRLLTQGEGDKWGFETDQLDAHIKGLSPVGEAEVALKVLLAAEAELERNPDGVASEQDAPVRMDSETGAHDAGDQDEEPEQTFAPASMFGGLAATLGAVAQATPAVSETRAISRNNYTIEKNRPEQNGIKRPSEGGLCRAVWDFLDDTRATTGDIPSAKQVREKAESMDWNMNNALIEFYQWRKFNGIIGRTKVAAK